jgi:hypothetical protein
MDDHPGDAGAQAVAQSEEPASPALWCAAIALGRLAEGKERVKEYVIQEPMRALGIALGVGVLIGWWTKRR